MVQVANGLMPELPVTRLTRGKLLRLHLCRALSFFPKSQGQGAPGQPLKHAELFKSTKQHTETKTPSKR